MNNIKMLVSDYDQTFYLNDEDIENNKIYVNKFIDLENLNSVFIKEGLKQSERLEKLNKIAISQMQILNDTDVKYLK